jgi:hypothetical protein
MMAQFTIPNAMPIADVYPQSDEKAFLRNGVRRLIVDYDGKRKPDRFDFSGMRDALMASEPLDLRFLLQMLPQLRHLILRDFNNNLKQPLLDMVRRRPLSARELARAER